MELSSCFATARGMKCLLFGKSTWGWLVYLVMWNTWGYNTVERETGYRRTPALWHTEVPSSFCQTGLHDSSSSASGQGFPGCLRWMVTSSLPGRYDTPYFHLPFFLFPCLGKGFSLFLVIWQRAVMVREKFMLLLSSSFRLFKLQIIIVTKHYLVNMDLGLCTMSNITLFYFQHMVCFREILDLENGKPMLELCQKITAKIWCSEFCPTAWWLHSTIVSQRYLSGFRIHSSRTKGWVGRLPGGCWVSQCLLHFD